jgi:hypothetical protein
LLFCFRDVFKAHTHTHTHTYSIQDVKAEIAQQINDDAAARGDPGVVDAAQVDLNDLSLADRERVLRGLFARINRSAASKRDKLAQEHQAYIPPGGGGGGDGGGALPPRMPWDDDGDEGDHGDIGGAAHGGSQPAMA